MIGVNYKLCRGVLFLFILELVTVNMLWGQNSLPHLSRNGKTIQLIVDGDPYLVLGGELHNSSSSSLEYLQPIWPRLKEMNLNTVLAVVSWDMIEPEEGQFDFEVVDGMIEQARNHDLRLILLWFGSWKNGLSHYVPDWVKENYERFPRARIQGGTVEVLSTFSEQNVKADASAFTALMRHIRQVDSKEHTVIMIQIQNEVGLLGDTRDRSGIAEENFQEQVPQELIGYLQKHKETLRPNLYKSWQQQGFKRSGTWEEVFGSGTATDEFFMAWNYGRYVNRVATAGKEEYPLPMFVNAWIVQPQDEKPGDYPSGGPQAHVHDIWKAAAPGIDILAPDIYLPNFSEIADQYVRSDNPLFVPESFAGRKGAANAFVAFGRFDAIGYSPFGIETRAASAAHDEPLTKAYSIISQLSPLILKYQKQGKTSGVVLNEENPSKVIAFGDYLLDLGLFAGRGASDSELPDLGYGLIIATGPDEYIVAGSSIRITFRPNSPGPSIAGLATVEEGVFQNGQWKPGRTLNGDAIMISYNMASNARLKQTGTALNFEGDEPDIKRVKLYRFE